MVLIQKFHRRYAYFLIGAVFLVYVTLRASLVGITHDEAATIQLSTEFSFIGSWARLLQIANNHLINTLWVKLCYFIGFDSLFLLRLPSVVSFLFYLYFSQRITSRISPGYIGLACFFLLSCNLFLLDFFGLARGYGMSIAFMMGALCLGIETLEDFSLDKSIKSLIMGSFAVISIYSMIHFWAALFFGLHLIPLVCRDFNRFKKMLSRSLIVGGGLFVIIAPLVSLLMWRNALYYGGRRGIYQDTILSLTKYSFYSLDLKPIHYIFSIALISVFVLVAVFSVLRRPDVLSLRNFILFIVACSGLEIFVSHKLLGVLYPIDRVALFLYPIVILALFLSLEALRRWVVVSVSGILVCVFSLIFVLNVNCYKTIQWHFDSRTEEVLAAINRQGEATGRVVSLGFDAALASSMKYYIQKNKYSFIRSVPYDEALTSPELDYYAHVSERPNLDEGWRANVYKIKENLARYSKNVFLEYPKDGVIVFCELNEY